MNMFTVCLQVHPDSVELATFLNCQMTIVNVTVIIIVIVRGMV
jgi:hypothetical protein